MLRYCLNPAGYIAALFLYVFMSTPVANSHPGYYGTAFHAHSVEQAFDTAQQENKLVFVYVGDDDRGWRHFRWPTKETSSLIDLLVRETVIVELNYSNDKAQVAEFNVDGPVILVMDSERNVLAQLKHDAVALLVEKTLHSLVTSEAGFLRIEAAIASHNNPFFNLERKAAAMALAEKYDESIRLYDQCLREAVLEQSLPAKSRRPQVIGALIALAEKNKNAEKVLLKNREVAAEALAKSGTNAKLSNDIARIDYSLDRQAKTFELFKKLPQGSRARNGMFDYVSDELIKQEKYEELLELIEPVEAIKGEITLYQRNKITHPASAERGEKRGSRAFVIRRGLMIVEALSAVGRNTESQKAYELLLEFDDSSETQTQLEKALSRAKKHATNK